MCRFTRSDSNWQVIIIFYSQSNWKQTTTTKIIWLLGGFFDSSDPMPESAFRQALDRINDNERFLPKSKLVSMSERLPPNDSHFASRRGINYFPSSSSTNLCFFMFICSVPDASERIGRRFGTFFVVDSVPRPIDLRRFGDSARQHRLPIANETYPIRHQLASSSDSFRPSK